MRPCTVALRARERLVLEMKLAREVSGGGSFLFHQTPVVLRIGRAISGEFGLGFLFAFRFADWEGSATSESM